MRRLSSSDAAWLLLESRDTPMHVGILLELTPPTNAPPTFVGDLVDGWLREPAVATPWNQRLLHPPLVGARIPVMQEDPDLDLDYHVRRSALPHPGGQRELGVLISRLHGNQLDLRRPLWEAHVIEGLEGGRAALYIKVHHALIDGTSAVRLLISCLSGDAEETTAKAFWTVSPPMPASAPPGPGDGAMHRGAKALGDAAQAALGLARAGTDLARASVDARPLVAPYRGPASALRVQLTGHRRFATQRFDLARIRSLADAAGCTINDVVLSLCGSALRRYLVAHDQLPKRSLTGGVAVNLRREDHDPSGNAVGTLIADLGTDVADPLGRLQAVVASTSAGKVHLGRLPRPALGPYLVFVNGPFFGGLTAGLGARSPVPFSVGISNVPGPPERLYLGGATVDAIFPASLLPHGNALNITCISYAGSLDFGFTGARDALPHLQRMSSYLSDAVDELEAAVAAQAVG